MGMAEKGKKVNHKKGKRESKRKDRENKEM